MKIIDISRAKSLRLLCTLFFASLLSTSLQADPDPDGSINSFEFYLPSPFATSYEPGDEVCFQVDVSAVGAEGTVIPVEFYISEDASFSDSDDQWHTELVSLNTVGNAIVVVCIPLPTYPCDLDGLFIIARTAVNGDNEPDNDALSLSFDSATIDINVRNTWVEGGGVCPGVKAVRVGGRVANDNGCETVPQVSLLVYIQRPGNPFSRRLLSRFPSNEFIYTINNLSPTRSHYFEFTVLLPPDVVLGPIPSHWEICFVAVERSSTPIGELDRNNNTACKPFTYGACRGLVGTGGYDNSTFTAPNFQLFTLTPNPSPGQVQINYTPVEAPVHIGIFNLQGQLVQQVQLQTDEQTGNAHFDLSSYPAGIYLVRMQEGNRAPVSRTLIIE